MINSAIQILSIIICISLGVAILYQYFLCFVYFRYKNDIIDNNINILNKFIIIIPANNEESVIKSTIESLRRIKYPDDKYQIIVIVDNCQDNTEGIVKSEGIKCYIRNDAINKGKGYALEWAFRHIDFGDFQAILIIDADTRVEYNILSVLNAYLEKGYKAIQTANLVEKESDNNWSSLFALGNLIKNYFVYFPKFKLGSSAFLLGTGMCINVDILPIYFQRDYSISEDIEFSLRLIQNNYKIAYASETHVESAAPRRFNNIASQRIRWSSGTLKLLFDFLPYFLSRWIHDRNIIFLDTSLTLLIWSIPLICISLGFGLLLTFYSNQILTIIIFVLCVLEGIYICLGMYLLKMYKYKSFSLIRLPVLIPVYLVTSFLGMVGYRRDTWTKTKRDRK